MENIYIDLQLKKINKNNAYKRRLFKKAVYVINEVYRSLRKNQNTRLIMVCNGQGELGRNYSTGKN